MESFPPLFFADNAKEHAVQCNFSQGVIYLYSSLLETVGENRYAWKGKIFFFEQIENIKMKSSKTLVKNI